MDKKSKILLYIFLIMILVSAGFTYYNMMIKRNFDVIDNTDASTSTEVPSLTN